jgi:hypothetical protein
LAALLAVVVVVAFHLTAQIPAQAVLVVQAVFAFIVGNGLTGVTHVYNYRRHSRGNIPKRQCASSGSALCCCF